MRALVAHEYGSNEVLQFAEVSEPKVGPDSVLIRTKAVSVDPVDWKIVRGYLDRAFPTHFPMIPCWDVAGVVERVGPAVVELQPGDQVLAYCRQDHVQFGTLSELVSAPVRCVGHKPAHLSWQEAAAIPLAGLTAHQCVDAAQVSPHETVLVDNAAGGVGSFAVQFAARHGATVIGTASPKNHSYLESIGAIPVDYNDREAMSMVVKEHAPNGIDVAFDFIGGPSLGASASYLGEFGRLVSIVESKRVRELGGRYVFVHPDSGQLTELAAIAASGQMKVEIANTFSFDDAVAALAKVEEGHTRGKVVICF